MAGKPLPTWGAIRDEVDRAVDDGLEDLLAALRIPSVSHDSDALARSAEYLTVLLQTDGWTVKTHDMGGNLIVFAEIGEGPQSVVVYGHHDVQPVEPLSAWSTPPFEPVITDGRIYCRGSADNKGQFFCHLFAVRALKRSLGNLPARIRLILDGQEEVGSPNLPEFVREQRTSLIGSRLCLTADGPTRQDLRPEVVFGVRGDIKLTLTLTTAATDLHSGNWGNIIPSAGWRLAHVIAQLKDADGRITVPGFYDDVVPPTAAERQAMADLDFDVDEAAESVGAPKLDGPAEIPPLERLMFLPALTVNGLAGGHDEMSVIPAEATAFLDVRLVVAQEPDKMFDLIRRHIERIAPGATLRYSRGYAPSRTPLSTPVARNVVAAVEHGFGIKPAIVPCSGGTLPDAVFALELGMPVLDVPYAGRDQRNHAANENMRLEHIHAGARTSAALFSSFGTGD